MVPPPRTRSRRSRSARGKPVLIGEFHFGALDRGLPSTGLEGVASQEERGVAYRRYVEAAAADPNVVGTHYFVLNDQEVLGRFDGENFQIGFVDVCHRPVPRAGRGRASRPTRRCTTSLQGQLNPYVARGDRRSRGSGSDFGEERRAERDEQAIDRSRDGPPVLAAAVPAPRAAPRRRRRGARAGARRPPHGPAARRPRARVGLGERRARRCASPSALPPPRRPRAPTGAGAPDLPPQPAGGPPR